MKTIVCKKGYSEKCMGAISSQDTHPSVLLLLVLLFFLKLLENVLVVMGDPKIYWVVDWVVDMLVVSRCILLVLMRVSFVFSLKGLLPHLLG